MEVSSTSTGEEGKEKLNEVSGAAYFLTSWSSPVSIAATAKPSAIITVTKIPIIILCNTWEFIPLIKIAT